MRPTDFEALFRCSPNPYMVLDRELRYVAANPAYERATGSSFAALKGRYVIEAFPNDPSDPNNESARQLRESFERVRETGQPDVLAFIAYRVFDDAGELTLRYWSATHTPVLDAAGKVAFILQHTQDVTDLHNLNQPQVASREHPVDAVPTSLEADVLRRAEQVQETNWLIEAERRHLRRLFEQAPGFICFLRGSEHVFEIANKAYDQLIGHRDILGKPIREALPEVAGQGYFELLDQVFTTGTPFVGRGLRALLSRTLGAPLEEVFLDLVYQPIVEPDGSISGIFVQGNDITVQKQLAAERERLAVIVQQSSDLIGVADAEGNVEYLNEAGQRMLGLTASQGTPSTLFELFLPQDRAFVRETIMPALRSEGAWEGEFRFRNFRKGSSVVAHCNVFALRSPETGELSGIATVSRDISELKRRELERAALIERERAAQNEAHTAAEEQRFLAETIPQHVWTATPSGALDFVNDRVLSYVARTREEVLGTGWQGFIHPDDLALCLEVWSTSLRTGEDYEVEFRLRRADGSYRWHLGRAVALRNVDGNISKWFGTNTDVDDAKRTRDELQKRTEFEEQLIGIVSHDLRTPLNAISFAASLLLRRGNLDDQQGQAVARIVSSSERAARLLRDFLDFTQARSVGRIPIRPTKANIREIARQALDEVHLAHPERIATAEHEGAEVGSWDADRIAQVVGNLVGNAFQHSPSDAPIRVRSRGAEQMTTIEVHNQGPPISRDDAARLFEPFQRGNTAKVTTARSVGLGLYISKQIVVAHGGTIEVSSTEQDGTTFRVRLPRKVKPSDPLES